MEHAAPPPAARPSNPGIGYTLACLFFDPPGTGGTLFQRVKRWRAAGALALLCACGCLTAAAGFFTVTRYYRGVTGVRFVDVAIPSRWPRVVAAQGHQLIVTGTNHAQRGQRREALMHLRKGVSKFPAHRAGRLLLGHLELEAGRFDAAKKTLLGGVDYHSTDAIYLAPLLAFLLYHQDDTTVVALAHLLLPTPPTEAEHCRLLGLAAATASFFRANYDQAEKFLRAVPRLDTSADGRLLAAKIDWERGYRDIALLRLRSLADAWPNDSKIHRELMFHLQQAGANDEARRRNIAFQIANPTLPAARIASLRIYHYAGEGDRVAREVDALLRELPDPPTLLVLAEFAASIGDGTLSRRIHAEAAVRGFPVDPHAFLLVETLLTARDYRGATELLRELRKNPERAQRYAALFASLEAVAHQGLGEVETARGLLKSFLLQPSPRADNLLALANRFVELDASEEAHQILERAVTADALNQAALTRLIELQLNLNRIDELPGHLRRLLAMRKPSPDVLRVAQHKLGSDLFLFSADRSATLDAIRLALEKMNAGRPGT